MICGPTFQSSHFLEKPQFDRLSSSLQAIFELSRGEHDLIEDLQLARKVGVLTPIQRPAASAAAPHQALSVSPSAQAYHDPMLKLSIMSEEELAHIFGNLDAYIPLHEDLLAQLSEATRSDGTVGQIGRIVVNWVSVAFRKPQPLL